MSRPGQAADQTPGAGDRGDASVKGAALWAAASQYSLFGLQFVTSVVISRFFLLPEEVGVFSIALGFALILAIVQDFGITRYLMRHPTADDRVVRNCMLVATGFSFLLAGLLFALSGTVARFYGDERLDLILILIGVSFVFSPFSIVSLALLQRRLQFRATFMINISSALASNGVALAMAAGGFSVQSLAYGMIANTLVRAIVAQALCPTALARPSQIAGLREICGFGSQSFALYLIGGLGTRLPDLIVGRMLGMTATGLYSRGTALSGQFHMLVLGAVGAVYYPAFARLRERGEDLAPYYLRVVAGHCVLVWPAMVVLAVLAQPVIILLYGQNWAAVAPLLVWTALAELAFAALPLHMDLPILTGRIRRLLVFSIADTALALGLLLAAATISLEAAAIARFGYSIGWFLLYVFWMRRLVGFGWGALARTLSKSALLAAFAAAPALAAIHLWRSPQSLGLDGLMAAGVGCAVFWLAGVRLVRHPARHDLADMIQRLGAPVLARLRPA